MSCKDCYDIDPLTAPNIDLVIPYGNIPVINYKASNLQEDPFDFTNRDFSFNIYATKEDLKEDTNSIVSYSTISFLITSDDVGSALGVNNIVRLTIKKAQLDSLDLRKTYYYILKMKSVNESSLVLMKGVFFRKGV